MKISLCIERLQDIMREHGDIDELALVTVSDQRAHVMGSLVKMTSTSLQSDMPTWPLNCTCLSISRDPLCVYHGDVDKVKAIMSKPELELYPPVTMPTWPPTWDDLQRLSRSFPGVHHTITLIERGDCTREQGLIWLTFALANAFQKLFTAEVDRRQREPLCPTIMQDLSGHWHTLTPADHTQAAQDVDAEQDIDEPCEVCGKPQANGVWVCDLCLDHLKTPRPAVLPPRLWPWPLFLCPGYKRSAFTGLITCKYCGHLEGEHGIGTSGGAVGQP